MRRNRFSAEQIVNKLRQAEVLLAQGQTVAQVSKALGRWPCDDEQAEF